MHCSPFLRLLLAVLLALAARTACAGPPAAGPPSAAQQALDEGALLRSFRQLVLQVGDPLLRGLRGWRPEDDHAPHCSWAGVKCSSSGHVTRLELLRYVKPHLNTMEGTAPGAAGRVPAVPAAPVVPDELAQLARLEHLERLGLIWAEPLGAGLPAEWVQLGAFPRLQELELIFPTATGAAPLLDIVPGALPSLQQLSLRFRNLSSTLPISWGGSLLVLPALKRLSLQLGEVRGGLPLNWPRGFHRLDTLIITSWQDAASVLSLTPQGTGAPAQAAHAHGLPTEWAAGFFRLGTLTVSGLGLAGSLPASWLHPSAFPELNLLNLSGNKLTGPLPADLFSGFPNLEQVDLSNNLFSGTLPATWANSSAINLNLHSNRLSGPAFPPAWLHGSMPFLRSLYLGSNTKLEGTLPPSLPWPSLVNLAVDDTHVAGSVPANWCKATFAAKLANLYVGRSALEPTLPPCAATGLPNLHLFKTSAEEGDAAGRWAEKPILPQAGTEGAQQGARARLAASLACASLLLVGLTARVLLRWRRRVLLKRALERQRLWQAGGDDGQQSQQPSDMPGLREAEGGRQIGLVPWNGPPRSLVRRTRRGRLASLLSLELRKSGGSSHCLDMAPLLQGHTSQTAHQLGTTSQESDCSSSNTSLQGGPAGMYTSGGRVAGGGTSSTLASQQWGLPTDSLRVPASDIEVIVDAQGELVEVGRGGHASVFLARLQPAGTLVALKVFELEEGVDSGTVWREVAMMRRCQHPRVVRLLGVLLRGRLLLAAMQLMPRGSLQALLKGPKHQAELRWAARGRQVVLDVAEALDHLHTHLAVLHSDIKPANVLLSADWRACLADLGLAQMMGSNCRTAAGLTRVYAAPEQLMGQRCGLSADMYSFGLLLVSLLTQQLVEARGSWRLPRAPDECPQDVPVLIEECLSADPARRPTAAQALARLRAAR